MIPRTIYNYQASGDRQYSVFDTGIVATCFSAHHIDFELSDSTELQVNVEKALEGLPKGMNIKITSQSDFQFNKGVRGTSREGAISDIGTNNYDLKIYFEKQIPGFAKLFRKLLSSKFRNDFLSEFIETMNSEIKVDAINALGLDLSPSPCTSEFLNKEIKSNRVGLQADNLFYSVIRLNKLGTNPIDMENLTTIRELFPDTSIIVTQVQKLDDKEIQFFLQRKSKREESGHDLTSRRKYVASQKAIEEVDLLGKSLFKFEISVILNSKSEIELIDQSFEIKNNLKSIGDFSVENVGAFQSLVSSLPGGKTKVCHYELIDRIPSYLPIFIRGKDKLDNYTKSSLIYHRLSGTPDKIELFDKSYSNYSGIVIGRSGRGKSVFINTLLQSLHNDVKTRIILVDVKGSHTNTVESLGGDVYKIGSTHAGLVSPFQFLSISQDKATIEILSDFIEKILIEDNESSLKRSEQSLLESCLSEYAKNVKTPSLDEFLKMAQNLPRKENLLRWKKGGIYESVFSNYGNFEAKNRLQYFDFTNILTAQKGGVGPSVMSAIMAHFNFLLLSKKTDEKLIFIADETPFFVKNCFSSFNLLMKNVRKLNGSLLLVAQNLSDLVVNGDGSLVSQPEFKVFFTKDEVSDSFERDSGLTTSGLETLKALQCVKGKYSQFLLKDTFGERVGCLYLSKNELMRATTEATDRKKIEKIKEAFSFKSDLEAIELLANLEDKYETAL